MEHELERGEDRDISTEGQIIFLIFCTTNEDDIKICSYVIKTETLTWVEAETLSIITSF